MNKGVIKEYLKDNMEVTKQVISELNSYNGCLDYLDYFVNDEYFLKDFFGGNPDELARAICYGSYNYNDYYVKFDGYDNLETASEAEVDDEIMDNLDEIIDNLIDYQDNIDVYDTGLLELLEEEEEVEVVA